MTERGATGVPVYQEYMNPILAVLRRVGRPLTIEQLDRHAIAEMKLAPEVAAIPHDVEKPDRSEVSYRIAWSRTYLKKAGLLDNPKRGQWGVSEKGRSAGAIDAYQLASEIGQASKAAAAARAAGGESSESDEEEEEDEELLAARVGDELSRQIRSTYEQLASDGQLLSADQAARCYRRFRELFGPDVLGGLDGEALLTKMHGRGTKDSLVYWLEFKDDDEFPARFGSIGGGSALKFGIYQASETGQWMTGSGRQQSRMTIEEAVAKARTQRDQLVAGARVLAALPSDTEAIDYASLQDAMVKAAPDLAEASWGHKYFALLFPQILEPFHGEEYQAHQLRKLLKLPGRGRYENARIFAGVARQLDLSLLDLAAALWRSGGPHKYWRVGTTVDDKSEWERMRAGGFAAVGWEAIGDLSDISADQAGKQVLRERIERHYPAEASTVTKAANQIFHFLTLAQEGDVILAMEGARVRGVGRITGAYSFKAGDGPCPHRRGVQWLRTSEWKLPQLEGMRTTFVPIKKDVNIIETEARLLGSPATIVSDPVVSMVSAPMAPLTGVVARIDAVLQRKRQVILYDPPGTGKTFWAERAVEELAARAWFGLPSRELDVAKREQLRQSGAVEVCAFHPAYGYEDFLEGFRPSEKGGAIAFQLRDGVFKRLCARAERAPAKPHFLIIDEINRGDIPRIFGELLTVLEREKRGRPITLPLSGAAFAVPDNVFVVGTMNTADRSIALLDAALRRRFGFVELLPDSVPLAGVSVGGLPLGPWLDELNRRVVQHAGRDARHLQVGHSYLLPGGAPVRDVPRFAEILRDDIVPLLEEYCYEDFEALEKILGSTLIQKTKQRVDVGLFDPSRHMDLIQALLSAFEGITATKQAVEADVPADAADEDDVGEVEAPPGPAA
jgi:5-methylcytosine-specific restriction protein B